MFEHFHATLLDLSARYRMKVRSGIERLRRAENSPPWRGSKRKPLKVLGLMALAAVGLGCWMGLARPAAIAPTPPAPALADEKTVAAKPLPSIRIFDDTRASDEEDPPSLVFGKERFLPVRLDQDLVSDPVPSTEISLPRSLRF